MTIGRGSGLKRAGTAAVESGRYTAGLGVGTTRFGGLPLKSELSLSAASKSF